MSGNFFLNMGGEEKTILCFSDRLFSRKLGEIEEFLCNHFLCVSGINRGTMKKVKKCEHACLGVTYDLPFKKR